MVGLVGLLVVLVLLLIFLTLPLSDWRALWRWLKGRRPGSRLVRALSAAWRNWPKKGLERVRAGRARPGRRPEEAGPAAKAGRPSYQERVGRPVVREMARAQGTGAGKTSPPPSKKKAPLPVSSREAPVVRWPFRLLFLFVLLLGLFISLYPLLASRLAAEPPHHLTLLVAVGRETAEGEQLLQDLRSELNREGLTHTVSLQAVPRPSTPEAAYAQVTSYPADFLLWGDPLPGGGYALTLTLYPRPDPEQPELNEYLQVMVTPPHFPLGRERGLTAKEVAPLLAWLARFYLGEFGWTFPQEFSSGSPFPDVLDFHQAGLFFLRGDYDKAFRLYAGLAGYDLFLGFYVEVGPPLSPASAEEALRAAALNNGAVAWLQEAELENVPLGEAVSLLEEAARRSPDHSVILYNLGRAYLGRHEWSRAVEALQKALEGRPNDARTLALLGQACCGAGDAACAQERARQALEIDPHLPEAHLAMACYHLGQVDPGEAGREVDRAIRLAEEESKRRRAQEIALRSVPVPNLTWVAYRAAWTARSLPLLARSRLFQARRYLVEFYSKPPPGFGEYLWALVFGEESPLDRAQEELDRAAEVLPEGYEALCLRGEIALARGQLEEAAAFFLQAQEKEPSDREAYLRLAEVYLRQWRAFREAGREDEAVESLSRASEQYRRLVDEGIDPVRGYLGLGEVLQRSGQDEEAFWEYRWATDIDPNCAEAYLRMGLVERKLEQEVEALEHFTLAAGKSARGEVLLAAEVERGSILLERYLGAGSAVPSRELLNEARSAFERAVRATEEGFRYDTSGVAIRPAVSYGADYEARALCGLGRVAYEEGDYAGAERRFQEALRKTPNFFEALYGLGRVYLVQKDRAEKALEYLQRAVEQSPESIAANYYLGEAYSLQLQESRARRTYEKVLRLCQEGKTKRADDEKACDQVQSRLQGLSAPP